MYVLYLMVVSKELTCYRFAHSYRNLTMKLIKLFYIKEIKCNNCKCPNLFLAPMNVELEISTINKIVQLTLHLH